MSVTYVNTLTGRVLERDQPDPTLGARWQLQGAEAAPTPAPAGRPAGNATTDAWRAYAIAQGMPAEEATAATRDELRERFDPAG